MEAIVQAGISTKQRFMIHKRFVVLLALCIQVAATVMGQKVSVPAEVVACTMAQAEGVYPGLMDVEMGQGKRYEDRTATYAIKDSRLCCDFPKIGKMPGKIVIDLPVRLTDQGGLTAEKETEAGVMKMPLGIRIKLKLDRLDEARVSGNKLSFVLVVYGQFMGKTYPTTIHFTGKKDVR